MSQVLKYGVPFGERILCEAPGCNELATRLFTVQGAALNERFSCNAHLKQMMNGLTIDRKIKLEIPGERNVPENVKGK